MPKNKTKSNARFYLLLTLTFSFSTAAHSATKTIEVYGDSLSAGFLDATSLIKPPTLADLGEILSNLALFKITNDAVYSDKIENRNLAWVQTVAADFARADPTLSVSIENVAVSGAKTVELLNEVEGVSPPPVGSDELAFFFIGHNDLCKNPDTAEALAQKFSERYEAALKAWDQNHVAGEADLIPVGQINRVYPALAGTVWYRGKQENYQCADSWTKFFPYCPSYYEMYEQGTLDNFLQPRITAMNGALEQLAIKMTETSRHQNRFRYLPKVNELPYEKDFFAVDCYHLSTLGQATLGEVIYQTMNSI